MRLRQPCLRAGFITLRERFSRHHVNRCRQSRSIPGPVFRHLLVSSMIPTIAILGTDSDNELKHACQELAETLRCAWTSPPAKISRELPELFASAICRKFCRATPIFQFVSGSAPPANVASGMLEFTRHPFLPKVLRGRKLPLGKESGWTLLDETQRGDILATIDGRPVWKITEERGILVWSVSTPSPRLRVVNAWPIN